MPHVSIDGPARPPYVNVAFQQEEIELGGGGGGAAGGCWAALSHTNITSLFSFVNKRKNIFLNAGFSL